MKFENIRKYCAAVIGGTALALASAPSNALDFRGFTDSSLITFGLTDTECAFDPACSLSRGGVSDLMLLYFGGGAPIAALVAFAAEKADNIYYFDPSTVVPDTTTPPTYLAGPDGTFSDFFGNLASIGVPLSALGFISDPFSGLSGVVFPGALIEAPGALPFPGLVMEPSSVPTIPYDATPYLAPVLRDAGFSAVFYSNVDVPEIDATTGTGALTLLAGGLALLADRRKRSGKNAEI